jgi:hypothetical protein
MNCREFIDRLQQDLDANLAPTGPDVDGHVRDCTACAALHKAACRMVAGLRSAATIVPSVDLTPGISRAVRRDVRRRLVLRRGLLATAAAAAVLVAVAGRSYFTAPVNSVSDPAIAQRGDRLPSATMPQSQPGPVALRSVVVEAGEAVASLTSRTADQTVDQTRILFPILGSSSLVDFDLPPPEAPAKPLREAGSNLTAGLSPVADSARRAFDLFLRDVPPVGGPNKRKL